jgi:DNA-binding NtrC family response regulator
MNDSHLCALLVDDDHVFVDDFKALLPENIMCEAAHSVNEAKDYLLNHDINVIFLDIDLGPGGDGLQFLKQVKADNPYLPVIMITAAQEVSTIVKALRMGASDYVSKSPNLENLKIAVNRAITESRLQQRFDLLESEFDGMIGDLVGESDAMRKIRREMKHLSEVLSNVMITGQSGTGKELVARGIHRLSARRNQPFIAVNCAALSRELIESELFGHERGSFTGATGRHIGKFEITGSGTLFLDEITEIPLNVQAKLLRVLQEREFERVGGNRIIKFNGRILASSNRNIEQAVRNGSLREDLLFRLNVAPIHLPPLAERRNDIPLLVNYFIKKKANELKKKVTGVSEKNGRETCAIWVMRLKTLSFILKASFCRKKILAG